MLSSCPSLNSFDYIGLKGDQNTFSIKGIDLPDVGIDPETGRPLENQYMPRPFEYFSLTLELSDSPITVSKITCAPTVEKTTAQPSVQGSAPHVLDQNQTKIRESEVDAAFVDM